MKIQIEKISLKDHNNKTLDVEGIIDAVSQTGGPTLFVLNDGSGTLMLKGFEKPGIRAYPQIAENDIVKATVKIREYQEALEGEIIKILKLQDKAANLARDEIEKAERFRAEIALPEFLVNSELLGKLRPYFIKAATEIRLAIIKNKPIIVRHHNDTDGYSSGFAMERAIIPLIVKQHGGGKAPWEFYTRSPSATPFYGIEDSIKDTANSLSDVAKFSNKMPLVIIVDTGSGEESLLGIRQGKVHGSEFIVIDHHFYNKDVTSNEVLVHINPFVVGEDGMKFSAGMLCSELARFINPDINVDYIPALSGLADRIDNPPIIQSYLDLAAKHGYTKELLLDISAVIDFVSTKLRFMEAREYIEVLFGEPMQKQKTLVSLMAPYIRNMEKNSLEIAKSAVKREKIGRITLQILEIESTFSRNAYPKPGKVNGSLHDYAQTADNLENVVSIGLMNDVMTIRATESTKFSIHEAIKYLSKSVPEAFIEGGGHKIAGALKFVPARKEKILASFKKYLSAL